MKTPAQLEKILRDGFAGITEPPAEFRVKLARAEYMKIRARYGFASRGALFSEEISKLKKSEGKNLGLAFMPAEASGLANVCAFAGDCARDCVAYSGNGGFSSTQRVRLARLAFAVESPLFFAVLLWDELRMHSQDDTYPMNVRLNTYSDIRWEKVAPHLFAYFTRANFYDYTKHPARSRRDVPANYSLTYSVSEKTTPSEFWRNLEIGRNVAAVVDIRSGETPNGWRPIPQTFAGVPTVDGDLRDDRHNDPRGVVVILRRKHTLKASSGLITKAAAINATHSGDVYRSASSGPVSATPHTDNIAAAATPPNYIHPDTNAFITWD
jgi:hypothetical protein